MLIAVHAEDVSRVIEAVETSTGTEVTEIGEITAGHAVEIDFPDGKRRPLGGGWEHFS